MLLLILSSIFSVLLTTCNIIYKVYIPIKEKLWIPSHLNKFSHFFLYTTSEFRTCFKTFTNHWATNKLLSKWIKKLISVFMKAYFLSSLIPVCSTYDLFLFWQQHFLVNVFKITTEQKILISVFSHFKFLQWHLKIVMIFYWQQISRYNSLFMSLIFISFKFLIGSLI